MKSDLQKRAEAARARFNGARKPIVLEFAGVPKAGKTTTLSQIQAFLKRCGFRVEVVVECASICPIQDKKHSNFNVWTACMTLSQILQKTQTPARPDDPDVLILDRGLFDAVCWFAVMERLARIRRAEREQIERFLLMEDWRRRITGVIVMTAAPRVSMEREKGDLPVEGSGGSIMNEDVLQQMLDTTRTTATRLAEQFRIFEIDTSNGSRGRRQTAERVAGIVLDLIEEQLDEHILRLPAEEVAALFQDATYIESKTAERLVATFASKGRFISRDRVESDDSVGPGTPGRRRPKPERQHPSSEAPRASARQPPAREGRHMGWRSRPKGGRLRRTLDQAMCRTGASGRTPAQRGGRGTQALGCGMDSGGEPNEGV